MREYGQVQSAFWQSLDAQDWSDAGKLLAVYLLSSPHTNGIGCFRLPDGYVMADLAWTAEKVSKVFDELLRRGFAYRFEGVCFVPNFLRWNTIANGNVGKARLAELESLPKGEAKDRAARAMLEFCSHWTLEQINVLEGVTQTPSEGYANQNPTQPDPTQPEQTLTKPTADRFDDFWLVYPKKVAKQSCSAKWRARKLDGIADQLIADVQTRIAGHRPWIDGFIPNPETYINGSRWEDAIEAPKTRARRADSDVVDDLIQSAGQ